MLLQKLSNKLASLLVAGALIGAGAGLVAPQPAYAASASKSAACEGIGLAGDDSCGGGANDKISGLVQNVVTILTWIVGIAAVIMIIIAGFKYITSGGDSAKVSSAKTALISAIIGLIIVVLAQLIVRLVVNEAA